MKSIFGVMIRLNFGDRVTVLKLLGEVELVIGDGEEEDILVWLFCSFIGKIGILGVGFVVFEKLGEIFLGFFILLCFDWLEYFDFIFLFFEFILLFDVFVR